VAAPTSPPKKDWMPGVSDGVPSAEALALLDQAACGLLQTSDDGTFLRVNRTFCQWIGRGADELVGRKRFQDLLTTGGRIFHQTHWSPLLRMQGTVSEVKLELVHADGPLVPMVVNAIRHEHHGQLVHEIAAYVARDRDKYERELLEARKEASRLHAEAKDRALFAEQMIGIVSHDLRNPVSTIMLATELLGRGELSPAQQRTAASIRRAAERATRLIGDLLDFTQARMGAGLTFAPTASDLHEVVGEAVDELRLAYPGHALQHVRTGDGRCTVDASRLVQLVGNLVSNAMSHGRPETPVTVTTNGTQADALTLAVHNHGDAIPPAQLQSLFEPMTRGTNESSGHGVGLGLFIVREIAKGHGGTVAVRSSEPEGTTFTVTLPR
jgi:sigma-B regulation protein RsbU (phosphoserine phosphatase)